MTSLRDVVAAWRVADPKHIHPTREHESEVAYWESGRPQAEIVYGLVGEGASVLDFGCGDGRIAIPMAKLGMHVVAADAAPEMIERLEHNVALHQVNDGMIRTHVSDGRHIDLELGETFHAVNARAVFIHHGHADVELIVGNLSRLLKPGGFLIADWPVGGHHERRDWIDVTTWDPDHRDFVAAAAGLQLVSEGEPRIRPSVWVKK